MDINAIKTKMDNCVAFFEKELSSIRTSRAISSMLDNIIVEAYGSQTPINQLGNVSVPEANMITIQVWDTSLIKKIENSIVDSKLGINPQSDGNLIRLPVPKLSEERRNELSKVASQYSENAKISIRNVRRDAIDQLKTEQKEKVISQDEQKVQSADIQKNTDESIKEVEEIVLLKKNEILKV